MTLLNGDLAKTALTTENVLNSGSVTMDYASKSFSSVGTLGEAIGNITLTTGVGSFIASIGSTAASTYTAFITVTATTAALTVDMQYGTANATVTTIITIVNDTIERDANGGYTYNDHGVSFTITQAEADLITAGSTIGVNHFSAGTTGNVATYSTYSFSGPASSLATLSNITVATDNDIKKVRSFTISAIATAAEGFFTITLLDSASNTVIQDDLLVSAMASFSYNNHGISFTVDFTNMTSASTLSATVSLTALGTTVNALTYDDNSLQFQVGANENQILSLDVSDMRSSALLVSSTTAGTGFASTKAVTNGTSSTASEYALDVSTASAAAAAITTFNSAITAVSEERAKLGSVQNRLEHTINNLDVTAENLQASESRIRDVDMAKEMMEFTKNNILMQAAQAMLAQANQLPQQVLSLLG
jgi:flagellin